MTSRRRGRLRSPLPIGRAQATSKRESAAQHVAPRGAAGAPSSPTPKKQRGRSEEIEAALAMQLEGAAIAQRDVEIAPPAAATATEREGEQSSDDGRVTPRLY